MNAADLHSRCPLLGGLRLSCLDTSVWQGGESAHHWGARPVLESFAPESDAASASAGALSFPYLPFGRSHPAETTRPVA